MNAAPTINAALSLGNLEETILVEGASPLVETRSVGIGMVVDNQRVLELPLNGRQTLDLVFMTGMAVSGGTLGGARGAATSTSPGTIAVAGGLPKAGALLAEYHRTAHDVANDPALVQRLGELQHALEAEDAWRLHERVEQVLARLALPGDDAIGTLSARVLPGAGPQFQHH